MRPEDCYYVVVDQFDRLNFVDRATFEQMTTPLAPAPIDLQTHAEALRVAGYAVVRTETLRELLQAYELVSTLKARLRARSLSSS